MNNLKQKFGDDFEAKKKQIFEEEMNQKKMEERAKYEKQMLQDMIEKEVKRRRSVELEKQKLRKLRNDEEQRLRDERDH